MVRRKILDRPPPNVGAPNPPTTLNEPALTLIDEAMITFTGRTLVTSEEVINCLLDLRNALAEATMLRQLDDGDLISR